MSNLSFPTPPEIVRNEVLGPHFQKFHLNNGQVLHLLTEAGDVFFHSHPWGFTTNILTGWYAEEVAHLNDDDTVTIDHFIRRAGTSHRVEAHTVHRITALPAGPVLTLVEPGPWEQEWSFFDFREDGVWTRQHDHPEFWLKFPRA